MQHMIATKPRTEATPPDTLAVADPFVAAAVATATGPATAAPTPTATATARTARTPDTRSDTPPADEPNPARMLATALVLSALAWATLAALVRAALTI